MSRGPSPDEDELFARNLRHQREERGWSQAEMVRRLREVGVRQFHPTTLSRIENGDRSVRLAEASLIARVFGLPLAEMTRLVPVEAATVRAAVVDVDLAAVQLRRATAAFEQAQRRLLDARAALGEWIRTIAPAALEEPDKAMLNELLEGATTTLTRTTREHGITTNSGGPR